METAAPEIRAPQSATDPALIKKLGFDPAKVPLPVPIKHPLRFSIDGDHDKIPDLIKIVEQMEGLHPGLKQYLIDELKQAPTNAAELHLKDVEQPDAGFDLHISCRWQHHGRRKSVQGQTISGAAATAADLTPKLEAAPKPVKG